MYVIDPAKFKTRMKSSGFNSISDLSTALNIHRNTIHHYLSGNNIFSSKLDRIFTALDVKPADLIVKKETENPTYYEDIAQIIDVLSEFNKDITFVLFGSRSRTVHAKYSDWDIGLFKSPTLTHLEYIKLRVIGNEMAEKLPYNIDWVNLCNADQPFLNKIKPDVQFLGGKRTGWIQFLRRIKTDAR